MRLLFLGDPKNELVEWLKGRGEDVLVSQDKIDLDFMKNSDPEMIISYNYRYILPKEIFEYPKKGSINLHISYLPYNRGADPNIWSFLEDTPKGVTIHYIDEGVDTGDIILQKKVDFDVSKETLATSYNRLQEEIKELFKDNWEKIKTGQIKPKKQEGKSSVHFKKDREKFEKLIREKGWETPVKDIIGKSKTNH